MTRDSRHEAAVRSVIPADVLRNLRHRRYDSDSPYRRRIACPICIEAETVTEDDEEEAEL